MLKDFLLQNFVTFLSIHILSTTFKTLGMEAAFKLNRKKEAVSYRSIICFDSFNSSASALPALHYSYNGSFHLLPIFSAKSLGKKKIIRLWRFPPIFPFSRFSVS